MSLPMPVELPLEPDAAQPVCGARALNHCSAGSGLAAHEEGHTHRAIVTHHCDFRGRPVLQHV